MEWGILAFLLCFAAGWFCHVSAATTLVAIGPCRMVTDGVCPDKQNVKFYLYTSLHPSEGKLVDLDDASTLSDLNVANPTKIIIHGSSNQSHPGLIQIRQAYLLSGQYNIFVVDYAALNVGPDFPCVATAIYNAPHTATCIAQLVQWLHKARTHEIHVIGFSLGGHVAGLLANKLQPYRLNRITGLDPAGPLFEPPTPANTLDASDALFVDVIHTNSYLQGKVMRSGHVDFYMNGGFLQPGCGTGFFQAADCSHSRAPMYFAESITSEQGFWGWVCEGGLLSSILQRCQSNKGSPVLMGEHVPHSARGFIYVNTSSVAPFALGQNPT